MMNMGLDSNRDVWAGSARPGRRRFRPGESSDWHPRVDETTLTQPHPHGAAQVQRHLDLAPSPPQLTTRRREASTSRDFGATTAASAAVAASVAGVAAGRFAMPTWRPKLARAASDAYRRPKATLLEPYDGEDESAGESPLARARRNSSPPGYPRRRLMPGAYSEASTRRTPSISSYGRHEDDDDDIEVEEIVEESDRRSRPSRAHSRAPSRAPSRAQSRAPSRAPSRAHSVAPSKLRASSRDDYLGSSADRNRYRKRLTRRDYSDDEQDTEPPPSASEMPSTSRTRESSRARDRSESPRKSQRYQLTHVIEDSRPPVSSMRSSRRGYRSAESAYGDRDHHSRRSYTMRSSRSLNGSTSGPGRILGTIFGTSPSRRSSPDKFFRVEKHSRAEKPRRGMDCVICMEDTSASKGADLKCGHRMCNSCMKRIFEMSIVDPQHMPPRCCTKSHIPLKHVEKLFDSTFKRNWNRKFAEYSTHNRIYCPSRRCGEWIKPVNIYRGEDGRKVARCGRCKTKVCPKCNSRWHHSPECPRDEETNRFLDQAKEEGWKRCYRCKAMVELKEGCNHMTCRCGAQFCMICGVKWKGCSCPWFNYENGNNPWENNPLQDLNIPTEDLRRILRSSRPISMEELRSYSRPTTTIPGRPRPQTYEEELILRRIQEQRDADIARRMQQTEDRENPFQPIRGHEEDEGEYGDDLASEDYRRTSLPSLSAPPPPTQPPPPYSSYVSEVTRARGPRASMEQRLAERLSDNRPGRRSRPPSPPAPAMRPHVLHPRSPPLGHSADMGIGMAIGAMGMGSMAPPPPYVPGPVGLPPPLPPMMRPNPFAADYYETVYATPRSVHEPYYYGNGESIEPEILPSPRRRARRSTEERPKSSTLAGLTGYGRGMHRVFEWRNFVEPGAPEGEA